MFRALMFFSLLSCVLTAQQSSEAKVDDAQRLVTIRRILVEGTRLPTLSVIRLAQIKVDDQVNFLLVHQAMQKVAKVGLIEKIDFEYESIPEQDNVVILHLKCKDFPPSAKATIQIPKVDEAEVWAWLQSLDPLFTRELPPTEAAITFYAHFIGKYLETHGQPDFAKQHAIIADAKSTKGGDTTDSLIFKPVKRRGAR